MKNYTIYIKSNKHPRTINTPQNARCYWDKVVVQGTEDDLKKKVEELREKGEYITEICTGLGKRIYM